MAAFDHFDFLAPFYDRLIKLDEARRLEQHLALPTSGKLLDAGGGTGRVAHALREKASCVIVADLSIGMLRQAAVKDGLKPVCSLSEHLPFANAEFDRIVMVDAFHHVCDHIKTAHELWRVLRPGGRLVIEEPDVRTVHGQAGGFRGEIGLDAEPFRFPTTHWPII
jgi:demethylmenaquinone methyltransferase/2-methoxy-6-polyprenyl-1,4-benzoquinol methylase